MLVVFFHKQNETIIENGMKVFQFKIFQVSHFYLYCELYILHTVMISERWAYDTSNGRIMLLSRFCVCVCEKFESKMGNHNKIHTKRLKLSLFSHLKQSKFTEKKNNPKSCHPREYTLWTHRYSTILSYVRCAMYDVYK